MNSESFPGFEGITIRPVAEGDGDGLSRFYGRLSLRSDYFFRPYRDKSVPAMAHVVRQSLTGHEDGYVVLDRKGGVVGHVFYGDLSKDVPHLGIGLADEYQDSGLGTVLMQFLIAVARRKLKKEAIGLSVMKTNTRAIQLYEKCGFRITEECSFRSPNDSYVMQLDLRPKSRSDEEILDGFFARVLGMDFRKSAPGETRVTALSATNEHWEGAEKLGLFAFLRHGRCVVLARPDLLERVREVLSAVELPESVFAEETRRRMEEAVQTAASGGTNSAVPKSAWKVCFFLALDEVRLWTGPPTRQLSAEDGEDFEEVVRLCGEMDRSSVLEGAIARAVVEKGEVVAGAVGISLPESAKEIVRVSVGSCGGLEREGYESTVLSELVLNLRRHGRTALAEADFDDISRIQVYHTVGMRTYANLFRVWSGE